MIFPFSLFQLQLFLLRIYGARMSTHQTTPVLPQSSLKMVAFKNVSFKIVFQFTRYWTRCVTRSWFFSSISVSTLPFPFNFFQLPPSPPPAWCPSPLLLPPPFPPPPPPPRIPSYGKEDHEHVVENGEYKRGWSPRPPHHHSSHEG